MAGTSLELATLPRPQKLQDRRERRKFAQAVPGHRILWVGALEKNFVAGLLGWLSGFGMLLHFCRKHREAWIIAQQFQIIISFELMKVRETRVNPFAQSPKFGGHGLIVHALQSRPIGT
jgi:hypothetical protein